MKRRDFLAGLGGAGAAWPLAARAQQPATPVIGLLDPRSPEAVTDRMRGFRQGLKEVGFVEGANVLIHYRWAEGRFDRLPALAADLVRQKASVIAATNIVSALAAKAATSSIPIVFAVPEDPVQLGLVASLARPGGNATGINFFAQEVVTKRFELLRELVPSARRVAVLVNPNAVATTQTTLREAAKATQAMGLRMKTYNASTSPEIDAAFKAFTAEGTDMLYVGGDAFFLVRRAQMVNLASRYAIPASYGGREFAEAGGLMTYGSSIVDAYRQVGEYVGRILKGTEPTDLPVVQASKFEFVINAGTARMLGLAIPPMLLARADEVIE
jgi:putative ABC transport system substrate-binding protein